MNPRDLDELLSARDLPPLPPGRVGQIERAVLADLKPVRPLAPAGAYLAGLAGIFIAVCAAGAYIAGQYGWLVLSDLQRIAVFVPLAAVAAVLVFSLVRQMSPGAKHTRSSALLAAVLFSLLLVGMIAVFQPAHEHAFVAMGLGCFRMGMIVAMPAAFLFVLLLHRGAAVSPALTGAAAGGLAGLAGLAVLEVRCPNLNLYHIIVWHISVVVVCMIAGLVFSSVTFRRWRSNQ
ncbi:MAG TPA: NrsF family protein [Bryobacteraceae bacterium]|nr:NrsF family protein [Bryobacteraceae bacterium]